MLFALGGDPHVQKITGEHVPFEQEFVILLQAIERFSQAPGHIRHLLQLFGRQFVDVLVQWFAWIDLVEHPVQPGQRAKPPRSCRMHE